MSAPESYLLQSLDNHRSGLEAFKLALKELVLRKALVLEPVNTRAWFGIEKRKSALADGPELRGVTQPALVAVLALYRDHCRRKRLWTNPERDVPTRHFDGVFVNDLATVGRNWYSRSLAGYIDRHVAPALAERGLVRTEERKPLGGLLTRREHLSTSDGLAAAEELNEWLRVGRRLPRWVREKPEDALAYAAAAGAAVLLMTEFYPELSLLSEHARLQGTPGAEFGDSDAFDVGALSLGSGAFDGIDSAFSALDAGVDAGASDFTAMWGAVVRNWGGNGGGGNGGGGNGGGGNGGGGG